MYKESQEAAEEAPKCALKVRKHVNIVYFFL